MLAYTYTEHGKFRLLDKPRPLRQLPASGGAAALGPFACEGAVSEADWGSGFVVKLLAQ